MRQVKSKDTKPELVIRKFLFANGLRFRLHDKTLPGKPDLVLKKIKTAIFVNGCFWHGHNGCKYYVIPKSNTEWWLNKINNNIANDEVKTNKLIELGWNVIIIWECELKTSKKELTLNSLLNQLKLLL